MKILLKTLEDGGEMELVDKIRVELKSFKIELPPAYPSSSDHSAGRLPHPHSDEQIEMFLEQDEFDPPFGMDSSLHETHHSTAETIVMPGSQTLPHRGAQQRLMVYPQHSYADHTISDPLVGSSYPPNVQRRSLYTKRSSTGRIPINHRSVGSLFGHMSPVSSYPVINENDSASESPTHYEEQKHLCNIILIRKYEEERNELKEKLDKKDKEIVVLKKNHIKYVAELWQQLEISQSEGKAKSNLAQQITGIETLITQHEQQTEALHSDVTETKDNLTKQIYGIKELLTQQHRQHEKAIDRLQVQLTKETEVNERARSDYQRLLDQIKDEKKVSKQSLSLTTMIGKMTPRMTCSLNCAIIFAIVFTILAIVVYY